MVRCVVLAILCASALNALAQSRVALVSFQHVAMPQDVPAHLCTAIAQDRDGLLWFGTQGGLVRYDGYEYRVFRSSPSDSATLGGNYVRSLLVASDGRMWIGTFSGGLTIFDPRRETFTRVRHDANDPRSLAYDRVEGLAETPDGAIWAATTAGLDRIDPRSMIIEHFRHDAANPQSLADDRVRGLLVDRDGRLWAGTSNGLQRWLGPGRGFERIGFDGEYVIKLFEDARGRIWIGTEEHGGAVLDPRSGAVHRFRPRPADPNGLSHYWVYGFVEAVPNEIWIATFGGGIDVVDADSLAIVDRLQPDPNVSDAIRDKRIGAIFRDRSGVIWVGTWGEGMSRHDPRTRAFRALRFSPNRSDGLTEKAVVRALETGDGAIWIGTNGNGIDVFGSDLRRTGGHRADRLGDGSITCLAQSNDGSVWVATLNSALHRLRKGATNFERIPAERLAGGPIRSIAFTPDGIVWAGSASGMVRIDPRTLETKTYRDWPGAARSSPAIESIAVARNGSLWIGSDNGLYAFDPRTEAGTRIARDPSRTDALPDNWVPDLLVARDGRLWAGTAGGAAILTRWDGRHATFARVTSTPAEALIEDASGAVWIGPRTRVDPKTLAVRPFAPADGVVFRNFFIASRARTRNGALLFGSPEGLLIVEPSRIPRAVRDAPVIATALRVEGAPRPGAQAMQSLTLSPRERSFTVDVASLDFTSSPTYRYRLDPLDRDWMFTGAAQRSITYSRLPPGRYLLRVAANTRELRLPITVTPAFHQTWWFRVLIAFAILGAAYLAYRLRLRQLHARATQLEALVKRRTKELNTAYKQIEDASLTDPLTQLRNRRYLEQTIDTDLELAIRGGTDLVVLLVDLDHFKSVNDTYGHAAGDAVLAELARVLRAAVRASDVIVRWGGEEFLIVVRFVNRTVAPELAEKVRAAVESHEFVLPDRTTLRRTCSIGVAAWPASRTAPRDVPFERVVDYADAALYDAKKNGRNRWVLKR